MLSIECLVGPIKVMHACVSLVGFDGSNLLLKTFLTNAQPLLGLYFARWQVAVKKRTI